MAQLKLLELPTGTLLEKFGAGSHSPGSGSAAALMGLLSCRLIETVGALTLSKPSYAKDHPKIELLLRNVRERREPRLRALFQDDAEAFDRVFQARMARDASPAGSQERRHLSDQALEHLRVATDIPFSIADHCVAVVDDGMAMFDLGYKAARGDSGAAISAAIAGAMASVFVINLNLRSFRESAWANEQRDRCALLQETLSRKQLEAFERVAQVRAEDISTMGLNLKPNDVRSVED